MNYLREHDVLVTGIHDWNAVDNLPIGQKLQNTTYMDGRGRPLQKVSKETGTPTNPVNPWSDLVQFSVYDVLGREPQKYLPYTTTNQPGKYKASPLTQ